MVTNGQGTFLTVKKPLKLQLHINHILPISFPLVEILCFQQSQEQSINQGHQPSNSRTVMATALRDLGR
jgi:hypothetical protein